MTRTEQALARLIHQHNLAILGEAAIALGVGLITCVIVFGGVFWLAWLTFMFALQDFQIGSAATTAWIITGVFALVSTWSAWRRLDPIERVEAEDDTALNIQLGLGYATCFPVVNRQSIAGFASLLIGGPANIMDACRLWRSRFKVDVDLRAEAHRILVASRQGIAPQQVRDPRAIALLHRLGLIKALQQNNAVQLQATVKGLELLGSARL